VEFDDMIQLVLSQWRNVRQRKTTGVSRVAEASSMKTRAAKRKPGDGDVKAEFQISSSDSDESSDNDEDDYEEKVEEKRVASAAKTKIKLNPKTKKVGAPRKHMNITAAGERADRKWYDAAERGRKTAGEVTLADLLKSLDEDQPSLMDTQRRLSGVLFKYAEAESKKPKFKLMKNPVTVMDPFYVLPEKLLAACMKVLPVGNSEDSAISVDASQEGGHAGTKGAKAHKVETVIIRDVGSYTRAQIETFVRVQNLRKDVQLGMDMNKWLTVQGIPALPAEYHDIGNKVAVDILESYPYKLIEGLPNSPEFAYSLLYRATPPPDMVHGRGGKGSVRASGSRLSLLQICWVPGCGASKDPDKKLGWRMCGHSRTRPGVPASGGEWSGSSVAPPELSERPLVLRRGER
jgi:hypothetical protein